jgi:YNFM family putative membrane transporter
MTAPVRSGPNASPDNGRFCDKALTPMPALAPPLPPPLNPLWTRRGTPAYRRVSLALFLAGFATFSLLYGVQPLLPAMAAHFGVSPAESSLALSLSTGCLALAILGAGAVSASMQRRPLMFASMLAAALLNIVAALVPQWHTLLLARALSGLALGGVPAVAMAYLAEEIEPPGLGLAMGLYVGGTAFGGMTGRVAVSVLAEHLGWQAALVVLGGLSVLVAGGFWWLLPASRNFVPHAAQPLREHAAIWLGQLRAPGLPWLFAIAGLLMGAFVTVYNYGGFRLMAPPYGLSQSQIGLIFCAYVFGIVSSATAGALADRYGRWPVLVCGLLCTLAGLGLTVLSPLGAVVAGIVTMTIGFFVAHAVASGWVGQLAVGSKGHAASLYLLSYYLGSSVMGSAGGWFWAHGGWLGVAGFAMVLVLLALGAAWRLRGLQGPATRGAVVGAV